MTVEVNQLDFSDQHFYVGIDVHKKQWTITIRWRHQELRTLSMNPSPEELVHYMQRHYPQGCYHSVYEAGFCGFWIHRRLVSRGFDNRVINPADVPSTDKEKDRKSDVIDSRKLARELENDSLKRLYIPDQYHQQLRSLNRLRRRLVQQQTRIKCQIKGFLHYNGIIMPTQKEMSHWSGHFIQWLQDLSFSQPAARDYLDICLHSLRNIRGQLADILRRLRRYSCQPGIRDLIHNYLCSIPGISFINAMTLYCEIMDMKRFPDLDHLKSMFGLVPSVSGSGDWEITRGLTHRRNPYLRHIIIEAAWIAVRKDPAMTMAFAELTRRMSGQHAIIRIAKKLLNRIRHVWLNQCLYQIGTLQ